jgi:hypothetical protein
MGPLNFFRVSLIAGTTSLQGISSAPGSLAVKNVYPAPCVYAPGPAYITPLAASGGAR